MVPCAAADLGFPHQEPSVGRFGGKKVLFEVPKISVQVSSAYLKNMGHPGRETGQEKASWVAGRSPPLMAHTRSNSHARHCSCNLAVIRKMNPVVALPNLAKRIKSKSDMNFRGPLIEGRGRFGGDSTGTCPLVYVSFRK